MLLAYYLQQNNTKVSIYIYIYIFRPRGKESTLVICDFYIYIYIYKKTDLRIVSTNNENHVSYILNTLSYIFHTKLFKLNSIFTSLAVIISSIQTTYTLKSSAVGTL